MPEAAPSPRDTPASLDADSSRSGAVHAASAVEVVCVRCGYDQSGLLAPSAPAWPLESRCTECGCAIRWRDYFARDATQPRQWVEHARWRSLWLALPRTILVACTGRPLWTRLRMEHPIRWGRLSLLVGVPCGALGCWIVGSVLLAAWNTLETGSRSLGGRLGIVVPNTDKPGGLDVYFAPIEPPSFADRLEAVLPLVTKPTSSRSLTLSSYALVPTAAWSQAASVALAQGEPTPPMQTARQRVPIASSGWGPRTYWQRALGREAPWLPFTLTAAVVSIASFILLPIARRRAKVRAAHLARASVYLLTTCLPLLCVVAALALLLQPRRPAVRGLVVGFGSDFILLLPFAFLLGHWWYVAVKHYLRMERPWAVAASVTVLGVLSGVVADLATSS